MFNISEMVAFAAYILLQNPQPLSAFRTFPHQVNVTACVCDSEGVWVPWESKEVQGSSFRRVNYEKWFKSNHSSSLLHADARTPAPAYIPQTGYTEALLFSLIEGDTEQCEAAEEANMVQHSVDLISL